MNINKVPNGELKYEPARYLAIDFGEGEDYKYGYRRQEFVRVAKARKCFMGGAEHPKNTLMLKESALVDGEPSTCFLCIACANRYLAFDDGEEDENGEIINPHNYYCNNKQRTCSTPGHPISCCCLQ